MKKLFIEDYYVLDVKAHSVMIKVKDKQSGWVCDVMDESGVALALNRDFPVGGSPFDEPTEAEWNGEDELVLPENNTTWTILTIKEFMDLNGIDYNSGDTKLDLVNKTRLFYGLDVIES